MQAKNTIAVLDDHLLITEAIRNIVTENPHYQFAGGFTRFSELDELIAQTETPAFLLLDIQLDGEDGIAICRQLSRSYPLMKIIMLTGFTQPAIIRNAMKNGAAGFMLKNMNREDFWECIRKVSAGEVYLHPDIEKIIVQSSLDAKKQSPEYLPKLSRREKEVLQLIIQEMTTQEIADALFISVNTVETHRSSLLTKLGAKNIAGMVRIAMEKGLIE